MVRDFSDMVKLGGVRVLFAGLLPHCLLTYILVSERTVEWEEIDKDEASVDTKEETISQIIQNFFLDDKRWEKKPIEKDEDSEKQPSIDEDCPRFFPP